MKKLIVLSFLVLSCTGIQAQKQGNIRVRANSNAFLMFLPEPTVDKKSKLVTIKWPSTENNSWHDNIGILHDVPIEKDLKYIDNMNYGKEGYVPMSWRLTDEGENTILHCYLLMMADIVENLWLGNAETTILDRETGTIYQAKATVPDRCYNKVFGVKSKVNTVLDLQIIFPRLPETAKDLAIYGVPNWFMRGASVQQVASTTVEEKMSDYDAAPQIHLAHMVRDSACYDRNIHESWAVYNDVHLIKPVKEKTMALWRTPDATYLAIATEQNWLREYYGRGGNCSLLDQQGHQYRCKGVMGYPNDRIFWVEGYPGDFFAIVLIFEPLPLNVKNFTYVDPEDEPFDMWGAEWSGEVIQNLDVYQLRRNQELFQYHPRVVVK